MEKKTIPSFEQELESVTKELNQISLKERTLAETVNKNRIKFTEAQSSFSTNRNQNRVLSFLMRLKTEGKINGIYGRLVC